MTTTNTATFNLDLDDIIDDAFSRCGALEPRSGYDFKIARRSLNLLLMEWSNFGINLWTIQQGSIPLITGTGTYDLPSDTIDLLDQVVRTGTGTSQIDINLSRISSSTYSTIPAKNVQARPVQVWINRQAQIPQINVWPVPNNDSYTFVYWRLRRIQDAGNASNTQDIPFRFLPALIAGLAFHLSIKLPGVDPARSMGLKAMYDEAFDIASQEDREKASYHATPRIFR
jgi:hypothetical protein